MSRVHRRQLKRQQDVAVPTARTASDGTVASRTAGGYLFSADPDDWTDRLVVHGLGEPTTSSLMVAEAGILLTGVGDQGELWIPRRDLGGAHVGSGLDPKTVGADEAVVISWRLGDHPVATAFVADDRSAHAVVVTLIEKLLSGPPPGDRASVATKIYIDPEVVPEPAPPPAVPRPAVAAIRATHTLTKRPSAVLLTGVRPAAHLVLEDGRGFTGRAWGDTRTTTGEAVFCTGMTGYQETLTDPSYAGQVVVQAAPHIGNTGVNDEDPESDRIWVAGYVVRDPSPLASSWRSRRTLEEELAAQGIVGITDIDTRALVRHLRDHGAMRCAIGADVDELRTAVREAPSMRGQELASQVSTAEPYVVPAVGRVVARVAALDLGIKGRTPWHLAQRGVEVIVLPARTSAAEILALAPDGVFFSNGPGDPAATIYAHETLRAVLAARVPFFGICLGNQVLGHALGLGTTKLPFGHRGINHPVLDRATGRVTITSQNHGFAVEAPLEGTFETPYGAAEVSHISLFDRSVEGLRCKDISAFSVQYHPEAAAGPHDAAPLFDDFLTAMKGVRA